MRDVSPTRTQELALVAALVVLIMYALYLVL